MATDDMVLAKRRSIDKDYSEKHWYWYCEFINHSFRLILIDFKIKKNNFLGAHTILILKNPYFYLCAIGL